MAFSPIKITPVHKVTIWSLGGQGVNPDASLDVQDTCLLALLNSPKYNFFHQDDPFPKWENRETQNYLKTNILPLLHSR